MSNTTFEDDLISTSRRASDGKVPLKNEFLNFLDKSYDL